MKRLDRYFNSHVIFWGSVALLGVIFWQAGLWVGLACVLYFLLGFAFHVLAYDERIGIL